MRRVLFAVILGLTIPAPAFAAGETLLVSGRWDNNILVIDVDKALLPANDGTPNAIVNRARVTPDIDAKGTGAADTPASGQPVNVVLSPDRRFAYVVNHSGSVTPDAAQKFQHGHAGTVTILNVAKALDPANAGTKNAIEAIVPTNGFGPVGLAVTPDGKHAFVSNSEGDQLEDGGRTISIIDLGARKVVREVTQAWGKPGFACPPNPIPHDGPNMAFGCFTDSNAVLYTPKRGGLVFAANGGTDDVSVIDVNRALGGDAGAEIARIPVAIGPWGMALSPDGTLVATANRESARTGIEGNSISILDVEKSADGAKDAELARVLVGSNNPNAQTRPFALAFTPDGSRLLVSNFRSNNLSIVDVKKAIAGELGAEIARIPLATPSGGPSRPRGIAITPDGRYAAITGAARGQPGSGVVWILDLSSNKVAGRVTGVGNETYLLALLPKPQ
jgi:DNA-binding beta-propeller fold protein YncE